LDVVATGDVFGDKMADRSSISISTIEPVSFFENSTKFSFVADVPEIENSVEFVWRVRSSQ
jgi:hypothetical protein